MRQQPKLTESVTQLNTDSNKIQTRNTFLKYVGVNVIKMKDRFKVVL